MYQDQENVNPCKGCPDGYFRGQFGGTSVGECINCPVGYKCPQPASGITSCGVGVFQDEAAQGSCKQCTPGHFKSSSLASGACSLCNPGTWSAAWQASCTSCVEGKYKSLGAQTSDTCISCLAGKYKDLQAQTSDNCISCLAGKYAIQMGSANCISCLAGKYKDLAAQASDNCAACPSNSETGGLTGQTTCLATAGHTGSFGSVTGCAVGTFKDVDHSAAACKACPSNSNSPASSNQLVDCLGVAGYTGSGSEVAACAAGKFKVSALSAAVCTDCAAGKYGESAAQTLDTCVDCVAGKYQDGAGKTVCKDCGGKTNDYQDGEGETNCKACPSGMLVNNTVTGCKTECGFGKYGTAGTCQNCPGHSGTSGTEHAVVDECRGSIGYTGMGNAVLPCAVGTYKDVANASTACKVCPAHSSTSSTTSVELRDCLGDKGYTIGGGGKWGVIPCDVGTFKGVSAAPLSCINCTVGQYADTTAQASCKQCAASQFQSQVGGTSCSTCSASACSFTGEHFCRMPDALAGPANGTELTGAYGTTLDPITIRVVDSRCGKTETNDFSTLVQVSLMPVPQEEGTTNPGPDAVLVGPTTFRASGGVISLVNITLSLADMNSSFGGKVALLIRPVGSESQLSASAGSLLLEEGSPLAAKASVNLSSAVGFAYVLTLANPNGLSSEAAAALGGTVAAVVAAAVAGAVAAAVAGAVSGSVGGSVGGGAGSSASGGSAGPPVQALLTTVQVVSVTGGLSADLGPAHSGFTSAFGMFNLALESPDFMSGLKDSFSGVNASNASNVSNTSNTASNTANSSAEAVSSTLLGAAEEGGNGPPHSVDVSPVSPMLLEGEEEVEEEAEEASLSYFIPNADIAGIRGQLFDTAFYSFSLLLLPAIVMLCLYWLIRALLYCYTCCCGKRRSDVSEDGDGDGDGSSEGSEEEEEKSDLLWITCMNILLYLEAMIFNTVLLGNTRTSLGIMSTIDYGHFPVVYALALIVFVIFPAFWTTLLTVVLFFVLGPEELYEEEDQGETCLKWAVCGVCSCFCYCLCCCGCICCRSKTGEDASDVDDEDALCEGSDKERGATDTDSTKDIEMVETGHMYGTLAPTGASPAKGKAATEYNRAQKRQRHLTLAVSMPEGEQDDPFFTSALSLDVGRGVTVVKLQPGSLLNRCCCCSRVVAKRCSLMVAANDAQREPGLTSSVLPIQDGDLITAVSGHSTAELASLDDFKALCRRVCSESLAVGEAKGFAGEDRQGATMVELSLDRDNRRRRCGGGTWLPPPPKNCGFIVQGFTGTAEAANGVYTRCKNDVGEKEVYPQLLSQRLPAFNGLAEEEAGTPPPPPSPLLAFENTDTGVRIELEEELKAWCVRTKKTAVPLRKKKKKQQQQQNKGGEEEEDAPPAAFLGGDLLATLSASPTLLKLLATRANASDDNSAVQSFAASLPWMDEVLQSKRWKQEGDQGRKSKKVKVKVTVDRQKSAHSPETEPETEYDVVDGSSVPVLKLPSRLLFILDKSQQREVTTLFQIIDTDGSGELEKEEVEVFFLQDYHGKSKSPPLLQLLFSSDQDGGERISWEDWCAFFIRLDDLPGNGRVAGILDLCRQIVESKAVLEQERRRAEAILLEHPDMAKAAAVDNRQAIAMYEADILEALTDEAEAEGIASGQISRAVFLSALEVLGLNMSDPWLEAVIASCSDGKHLNFTQFMSRVIGDRYAMAEGCEVNADEVEDEDEDEDEDADEEEDVDEEEESGCLVATFSVCCFWYLVFFDPDDLGEWGTEGPMNLALGDYFGSWRHCGRVYWLVLQVKLLLLALAVAVLSPFPQTQICVFLGLEVLHLLCVLWVAPFINRGDHQSTTTSCWLTITMYTSMLYTVNNGDAADYSTFFVVLHITRLTQALLAQFKPILDIIAAACAAFGMYEDTNDAVNDLLGDEGEDEGPSKASLLFKSAGMKATLFMLHKDKPAQSPADEHPCDDDEIHQPVAPAMLQEDPAVLLAGIIFDDMESSSDDTDDEVGLSI